MIDPFNITKYDRTIDELQEFLLFICCVAGKPAVRTANNIEKLLNKDKSNISPFEKIAKFIKTNTLHKHLEDIGFGQYSKLEKCMSQLINSKLDLFKCSVEQLEEIHGIGPKSARYFTLHSRKNARVSCIDTHLLKFFAAHGYDVPKSTPTRKKYLEIEQEFLKLADINNLTPADLDLKIWSMYARGGTEENRAKSQILFETKDAFGF